MDSAGSEDYQLDRCDWSHCLHGITFECTRHCKLGHKSGCEWLRLRGNDEAILTLQKPAVDFVVALYAIAHLTRGAKSKVPASAASYHVFATIMDILIIPFYVYIALCDRWNLTQPVESKDRWRSLLPSQDTANSLIAYTWIIALVVGGLHLLTATISTYLAVMFHKIARLPPDLNPLEDNLTSRRRSKHKYKNSDMSSMSAQKSKHDSGISLPWEDQQRPLSFIATRNESVGQLYSPHNLRTANESRASLPVSVPSNFDDHPSSPVSAPSIYSTPSESVSRVSVTQPVKPPPRAGSPLKQTELSRLNSIAASSVYSDQSDGSKGSAPHLPRKSSKRASGTFESSENWSIFRDDKENEDDQVSAFWIVPEEDEEMSEIDLGIRPNRPYQPVRNSSFIEDLDDNGHRYARASPLKSPSPGIQKKLWDPTILLEPLGLNPPTPPPPAASQGPRPQSRGAPVSPINTNAPSPTSSQPSSPSKGRYYGDLKSAVQGVRNSPQSTPNPRTPRPLSSPRREPGADTKEWLTPPRVRETLKRVEMSEQPEYKRLNERLDVKGRVLSRSGADMDQGADEFESFLGMNRRDVSGKVAEEGMGGGWARRRVSGR